MPVPFESAYGVMPKLSMDKAERIRQMKGTMPQTHIAKLFGVHSSRVSVGSQHEM